MRKLSEDIRKKAIQLYGQKLSTVQVGKELGISSTCVSKILKEKNIYRRNISESKKGVKRGTKLPIDFIIHEYAVNNKTSQEIADELKCNKRSVLLVLKDNNVVLRKSGWKEDYENPKTKEVINLYSKGKSIIETSKETKLSITGINKILKKHNMLRTELKNKSMLGKTHNEETKKKVIKTKKMRLEKGLYDHIYLKRTGLTYKEFIKQQPEFKKYFNKVRCTTRKSNPSTLPNFDKRNYKRSGDSYQLDHKYSIIEGFKNNISPEVIGHICNLEMIPWKQNQQKQGKCSHTIEELVNKINDYNQKTTF